jgi:hypothetical protein
MSSTFPISIVQPCPPHLWSHAPTVGYFECVNCRERVNHDDPRYAELLAEREAGKHALPHSSSNSTTVSGEVERRYGEGHLKLACPGDRQDRRCYLLRFDDPDCREQVFMEEDAEQRAWEAWNRYAPSYNCYLFEVAALRVEPPSDVAQVMADFKAGDMDGGGTIAALERIVSQQALQIAERNEVLREARTALTDGDYHPNSPLIAKLSALIGNED